MKKKIKIVLIIVLGLVLLMLVGLIVIYHEKTIAILGYHNIYNSNDEQIEYNQFIIDVKNFEEQMKYLKDNNYKTLTLDEFYCFKKGECDYGRKTVMITFDDGYYYNYKYAFDILKKYNLNAVVFFVGTYASSSDNNINNDINSFMSLDTIEKAKVEYPNIEFASHSYNMHGKSNVSNLTKEEIVNDIEKFNSIYKTTYIAYPGGNYNEDFIKALKENNYKIAFGFGPEHRKAKRNDDDFDIPRLNISSDMSLTKFKLRINLPR